jgi:hypothetical protein
MKKRILWLGILILVIYAVLIFVSGTMGSDGKPIFSVLFALQQYYTLLVIVGIIIIALGIFLKKK